MAVLFIASCRPNVAVVFVDRVYFPAQSQLIKKMEIISYHHGRNPTLARHK